MATYGVRTCKYAVIGVGAIGGFIGGCLAHARHNVWFVARSNFADLTESGLTIDSNGSRKMISQLNVVRTLYELPEVDVIIVASKTTDIKSIDEQLAKRAKQVLVFAFHNGLAPESLYEKSQDHHVVLSGVAYASAQRLTPTFIRIEGEHELVIAPSDTVLGEITSQINDVISDLRESGLNVRYSANLLLERWKKVLWSLIFSGPCTILDVNTYQLVQSTSMRELQHRVFAEAQSIARADGVELSWSLVLEMIADAESSPGHIVSMTVDRRLGKPLEDDAIYGMVRRRAWELRVPTPTIDCVHALLSFN